MTLKHSLYRLTAFAGLSAGLSVSLFAQAPVLSETFESGKIDTAIWEQRGEGTATIAVEKAEGAHGDYALHVHIPDMAERNGFAFIVANHLPSSVAKHYFGRAYMKITPGIGTTHNPLIFSGEPGYPLSKFNEIGTGRGFWMPSYQENKSTRGNGRGEITYRADVPPPLDRWFLLEWEFNDDPSSITMWVDGVKLPINMREEKVETVTFTWPRDSETTSGLVGEGYKEIGFGTRVWGSPPVGIDVYYDDIVIDTKPIGPAK